MSCRTDCSAVFSQGPIIELCFLPAACCERECMLSLSADTEPWSSFLSSKTLAYAATGCVYPQTGSTKCSAAIEVYDHGNNGLN